MIVTYIFTNITNMTYDLASLNGVCSFTLFYSRMKSFSCCLHKFQNDSVFHICPLPVTHTHAHISAGTCPECKNRHAKCLRNQNTWILNLSLAATNPLEFLQSVTKNIFFHWGDVQHFKDGQWLEHVAEQLKCPHLAA